MYNSYFGFRESPFSVTPDPRFFYANTVYREAFVTLRYGIDAKKGFIVITGEVGTGKTTLLRKLLQALEETVHSVFVFNTYLNFPELLELTLHDLGLTTKDQSKVTMLQQLNEYLIEQLKRGHTVAILIDEAQNLSDEVLENLRLLSNLETDQEKLIQIVLMGQPELRTKLAQPRLRQLKQRVALQCRLYPLKDTEVGPYIDSRLQAVGYAGPAELFRPEAIERIAFYSKGIPRLMNIICDNALLNAYAVSQHSVSAEIVEEVARDLELRQEPRGAEANDLPIASAAENEATAPMLPVPAEVLRTTSAARMRAYTPALLAMFVLIALAAAISSPAWFNTAGKRLEFSNQNSKLWAVPAGQSQANPKAEAEVKQPGQRIIIQPGFTIQKIAADTYGPNTTLGMDVIKEFNPQIENLNWVYPGQEILLPALTRETLLRKQGDGSYRVIVASFANRGAADAYVRGLAENRYHLTITPNRVSNDLLLQRVEIDGLKNLDEARQAWDTGMRTQWFAFISERNGGEQLSKADITY